MGISAGIAFQLQDDLLNLVGDAEAQGKDFRSDITEGKRTLAVVYALASLDTRDREELVAILGDVAHKAIEPHYFEARPGDIYKSMLANGRARRALGWAPAASLHEGLKRTYAYFEERTKQS